MKKTYLLTHISLEHSTHNGVPMYRLSWLDPATKTIYESTVDETYDNWPKWRSIVTNPRATGYYCGLKRSRRHTRDGTQVMSADSVPQQVEHLPHEKIYRMILDQVSPPKNNFNEVFGE